MSYRSLVFYTGTGSEQNLTVTFPYLDVTHVNVSFYNTVTEEYDLQDTADWSWLNSTTVTLTNPDTTANGVKIWRSTGFDPLVTFTNASLLNEDDQNMAALQAIYLIEELLDSTALGLAYVDVQIGATNTLALTFVVDSSTGTIGTGELGSLYVPFSCDIISAVLIGDQTGTCEVDVWKAPLASNPPTVSDSIVASAPMTVTAATYSIDSTLTGWTKHIAAGSVLKFKINSTSGFGKLTIVLIAEK